jgi:hypothetical protein
MRKGGHDLPGKNLDPNDIPARFVEARCLTIPMNVFDWSDGTFNGFVDNEYATAMKVLFFLYLEILQQASEVHNNKTVELLKPPIIMIERLAYPATSDSNHMYSFPRFTDTVHNSSAMTTEQMESLSKWLETYVSDKYDCNVKVRKNAGSGKNSESEPSEQILDDSDDEGDGSGSDLDVMLDSEHGDGVDADGTRLQMSLDQSSKHNNNDSHDEHGVQSDSRKRKPRSPDTSPDGANDENEKTPKRSKQAPVVSANEFPGIEELVQGSGSSTIAKKTTIDQIGGAAYGVRFWFLVFGPVSSSAAGDDYMQRMAKAMSPQRQMQRITTMNVKHLLQGSRHSRGRGGRGRGGGSRGQNSSRNAQPNRGGDSSDSDGGLEVHGGQNNNGPLTFDDDDNVTVDWSSWNRRLSKKENMVPSLSNGNVLGRMLCVEDFVRALRAVYGIYNDSNVDQLFLPWIDMLLQRTGEPVQRTPEEYFTFEALGEDVSQLPNQDGLETMEESFNLLMQRYLDMTVGDIIAFRVPYTSLITVMGLTQGLFGRMLYYKVPFLVNVNDDLTPKLHIPTIARIGDDDSRSTVGRRMHRQSAWVDTDDNNSQLPEFDMWGGRSGVGIRLDHAPHCGPVIAKAMSSIRKKIEALHQDDTFRQRFPLAWEFVAADLQRLFEERRARFLPLMPIAASVPQTKAIRIIASVIDDDELGRLITTFSRQFGNVDLFGDFILQMSVYCVSVRGIVTATGSFILHFISGLSAANNASSNGLHIMTAACADSSKSFVFNEIANIFPCQAATPAFETDKKDSRNGNIDGELLMRDESDVSKVGAGIHQNSVYEGREKMILTKREIVTQALAMRDGERQFDKLTLYAMRAVQCNSNVAWHLMSEAIRSRHYRNIPMITTVGDSAPNMYQSMARSRDPAMHGVRESLEHFYTWLTTTVLYVHMMIDAGALCKAQTSVLDEYYPFLDKIARRLGVWGSKTTFREYDRLQGVVNTLVVLNAVLHVYTCPLSPLAQNESPHNDADFALLEPHMDDSRCPGIIPFALGMLRNDWETPEEYRILLSLREKYFNLMSGESVDSTDPANRQSASIGDNDQNIEEERSVPKINIKTIVKRALSAELGAFETSHQRNLLDLICTKLNRFRACFAHGHRGTEQGGKPRKPLPKHNDGGDNGDEDVQVTQLFYRLSELILDGAKSKLAAAFGGSKNYKETFLYEGIVESTTELGVKFTKWLLEPLKTMTSVCLFWNSVLINANDEDGVSHGHTCIKQLVGVSKLINLEDIGFLEMYGHWSADAEDIVSQPGWVTLCESLRRNSQRCRKTIEGLVWGIQLKDQCTFTDATDPGLAACYTSTTSLIDITQANPDSGYGHDQVGSDSAGFQGDALDNEGGGRVRNVSSGGAGYPSSAAQSQETNAKKLLKKLVDIVAFDLRSKYGYTRESILESLQGMMHETIQVDVWVAVKPTQAFLDPTGCGFIQQHVSVKKLEIGADGHLRIARTLATRCATPEVMLQAIREVFENKTLESAFMSVGTFNPGNPTMPLINVFIRRQRDPLMSAPMTADAALQTRTISNQAAVHKNVRDIQKVIETMSQDVPKKLPSIRELEDKRRETYPAASLMGHIKTSSLHSKEVDAHLSTKWALELECIVDLVLQRVTAQNRNHPTEADITTVMSNRQLPRHKLEIYPDPGVVSTSYDLMYRSCAKALNVYIN